MSRLRLTVVETHPVQYNAPWFRSIQSLRIRKRGNGFAETYPMFL